ncbi:MAG: hypothetical protein JJ992_01950, partial [Planctomycetes bacterium]|nr:hypothetical protein [Planctomycetota bacterium]
MTIAGTPAQKYLESRGIALEFSDVQVRWNPSYRLPDREHVFSAMLIPLRDGAGEIQGIASTRLSEFGGKDGDPAKLTVTAEKGLDLAGVLGDPKAKVLAIAEGLETGLSRLVAGPVDLRVCCGSLRYQQPRKGATREVEVIADRDKLTRARSIARQYRTVPAFVVVPGDETGAKGDLNDTLQTSGVAGVQQLLDDRERVTAAATDDRTKDAAIDRDSDVAIAQAALAAVEDHHGELISSDGSLWYYGGQRYHAFDPGELRRCIYTFDGAIVMGGDGKPRQLAISSGRATSVSKAIHDLRLVDAEFFHQAGPMMIPAANGVVIFDEDGAVHFERHHRRHRNRHVLPGQWSQDLFAQIAEGDYGGSLLGKLVDGCFLGDPDKAGKIVLLQEVGGAIATGSGTKLVNPKAIFAIGRTAENGKSQFSELFRNMADDSVIAGISPARFAEDYYAIRLVGVVGNIADELPTRAITTDRFKQIVTGETIAARQIFNAVSSFRPVAQHWYTANDVPRFVGGVDAGVLRRLLPIEFLRTIPKKERIPELGKRIATEEADMMLAFAACGAHRLAQQRNFTVPKSSDEYLTRVVLESDPVRSWAVDNLHYVAASRLSASTAYEHFRTWYTAQGHKREYMPNAQAFGMRIHDAFPERTSVHTKHGSVWTNLDYKPSEPDDEVGGSH